MTFPGTSYMESVQIDTMAIVIQSVTKSITNIALKCKDRLETGSRQVQSAIPVHVPKTTNDTGAKLFLYSHLVSGMQNKWAVPST